MDLSIKSKPVIVCLKHCPDNWIMLALLSGLSLFAYSGIAYSTEFSNKQLTEAQSLIYDRAHLSNTAAGQNILYRYISQIAQEEPLDDEVSLSVTKTYDDDKRDVVLDFLSAERHMAMPDFSAFRGNPVIIAMLEHIAQSIGRDTGGGVLYFRNRIRDSLANKSVSIEDKSIPLGDNTVTATVLEFTPFEGDSYLAEKPEYTNAVFSITLSEEVPGGVVSIAVTSRRGDHVYFLRKITLKLT